MSRIYDLQGYKFRVEAEKNCLTESIELLKELSANRHIFLFDGKQMNIKFDRILKEISTGLSFKKNEYKNGDSYRLNYSCDNNCVQGLTSTVYANIFDSMYFDFECSGNRFEFSKFESAVEWQLEYCEKQLGLLIESESNIESLMAERKEIAMKVSDFNKKLDYVTGEFLRID